MHHSLTRAAIMTFALLLVFHVSAFAEEVLRRQIVATQIERGPKIDGKLDDAVWRQAQPSEGFSQIRPHRGKPMHQRTVLRVLYDDANLYISFQCDDSEPDKVLGTEMRRDYSVWHTDDYIQITLDTYHDLRNGYYFGTNPRGAKVDSRITDNGSFHMNWDAVWDVAATRHSEGWSAEFRIPFTQLRFPDKEEHVWGFNAARIVQRAAEEGRWSPIEASYIGVFSEAGELVGLSNLPQGRRLEVRPTGVLGSEWIYGDETVINRIDRPSLDVKIGVTSDLTLDATVNTDFAQVEADEEKVNLSRYDLFFPEKRPFFLEGVGIFGNPDRVFSKTLPIFYSRRIGSAGGREARILGGAKLTGKLGRQSIGLLNVQTDDVQGSAIPATNFTAFRVKRDVLRSSSVGVTFLNKLPREGEGDHQTFGLDGRFNPRSELTMEGSVAKTWTEGVDGNDIAGQFSGEWQGENWNVGGSHKDVQEDFNAEMGFVNRTDIQESVFWWGKSFQVRRGMFRRTGGNGHYAVTTRHDGGLESRSIGFDYDLELTTGDWANFELDPRWEVLGGDWEIRQGIVIPEGLHRWTNYSVRGGTDSARRLRVGGSYSWGGFYDGERRAVSLDGHIRPVPNLLVTGSYNRNTIELDDGSFTTNTINNRWIYNVSPDLFLKLFLQWNDDSEIVRGNFLIRYTYRPGSDFYIVYNELWQHGDVARRSIVGKLTHFLNL